jgi:hypothetical protein
MQSEKEIMEQLDISWCAIFKVILAGSFTYVILPALLVLRDLCLHYAIGKFILTSKLNIHIMMCESDRWYLDNKYNKSVKVSYSSNGSTYEVDGQLVSKEQYLEYEQGKNFHLKRVEYTDSKIVFRHNLITWLTKHYQQAEGGNPIPELRKNYYESAGAREEKAA